MREDRFEPIPEPGDYTYIVGRCQARYSVIWLILVWLRARLSGPGSDYGFKFGSGSTRSSVRHDSEIGDQIGAHYPDHVSGLGSAWLVARLGLARGSARLGSWLGSAWLVARLNRLGSVLEAWSSGRLGSAFG